MKANDRVQVGDSLANIGRQIGLSIGDFKILDRISDKTPAQPLTLDSVIIFDTNVVSEAMRLEPNAHVV